jgi:SAM-dependent methyltransferase
MTTDARFATERDAIHERYARRTRRYDPYEPWVQRTAQELDRALADWLRGAFPEGPARLRLLEVGCGSGRNLLRFQTLGFDPANLAGNELQADRCADARRQLPAAVTLYPGDALDLPAADGSFDVVFQSLVFSSVLDPAFQQALAAKLWRLARPGGGVLWYDFTFDNPANPDVRGVRLARVRELFPGARIAARRVTLAPPLSRRVTALHPALYGVCNALPFLRTHLLCWISRGAP